MRRDLAKSDGERKTFRAIFSRVGKKVGYTGYSEDTILLTRITEVETGRVVADHVWFTYSKGFEAVALKPGVAIEFDARVRQYTKGYVNRQLQVNRTRHDYKLSHPTKIKLV